MILRVLSVWLILSIIGYGSVMATETHLVEGGDQGYAIQYHLDEQGHDHAAEEDDSDHCCHGSLHLVGLHMILRTNIEDSCQSEGTSYQANYTPPPSQNLLRPPATV